MRRAIAVAVLGLATAAALVAAANSQPLKVKTGLWQMTQTSTWTGLPQEWAAVVKNGKTVNYKSCVRAKDLTRRPEEDPPPPCLAISRSTSFMKLRIRCHQPARSRAGR